MGSSAMEGMAWPHSNKSAGVKQRTPAWCWWWWWCEEWRGWGNTRQNKERNSLRKA